MRAHEAELRAAGIDRLSLFGPVARGAAEADSDMDLAAELEPNARIGLLELADLGRRLTGLLSHPVEIQPEPAEKRRLQANIDLA